MKRYRIVTLDLQVNRVNRSGVMMHKNKAIKIARMFNELDCETSMTLVQKKVRGGWMRVWPDRGPTLTDVNDEYSW